ncbi:uncharacterized protein N7487_006147, partial [Penicillium crustosum]|uniref:uncharacterized protein n=1 Tax=Penicillium crustosum TaxID=36656 RepID=UPI002388356B
SGGQQIVVEPGPTKPGSWGRARSWPVGINSTWGGTSRKSSSQQFSPWTLLLLDLSSESLQFLYSNLRNFDSGFGGSRAYSVLPLPFANPADRFRI